MAQLTATQLILKEKLGFSSSFEKLSGQVSSSLAQVLEEFKGSEESVVKETGHTKSSKSQKKKKKKKDKKK